MDNLYSQSIYEYLLTKKEENKYSFNILSEQGNEIVNKLLEGDWSMLPCAAVFGGRYKYITTDLQNYSLDFSKELPAILLPSVTILADNVSDIVEIEKSITELFFDAVQLKTKHPYNNGEYITFDVVMDKSVDIDRSQSSELTYPNGKRKFYQTIIRLYSTNNILFMRNFHPAEIQFDKNMQFQLAERGMILEELQKQVNIFTAEQVRQISSGYNEIVSLLGISALEGFGFAELFQVMSDKKCDINTAMSECIQTVEVEAKRIAKEQRKEEELKHQEEDRIKCANEKYSKINKTGDIVINRYTDVIVADFKSRMCFDYPVSVYGGSTFLEWKHRNEVNELEYPNVLVNDSIDFTFDHKVYKTITKDSAVIERPFSAEVLPINLKVDVEIQTKSQAECEEIANHLKEVYTNPQEIMVALPMHQYEEFPITVHYDEESSKRKMRIYEREKGDSENDCILYDDDIQNDDRQDDDMYIEKICFYSIPCIYYDDEQNKIDISNNLRLQINLLKQAAFLGVCSKKLVDLDLSEYYCMTNNSVLFKSLFSDDLKTLRNCYINKLPLDEELFKRVFNKIIDIYPNLYDKANQGWSKNQVWEHTRFFSKLFNRKCNEICLLLEVYENSLNLNMETAKPPHCSPEYLRDYANMMIHNENMSLKEAIERKEEIIIQERNNYFVSSSNDDGASSDSGASSGRGGMLSRLFQQSVESHNIKKHAGNRARRDLIGQAGCAKTHGGDCYSCNIRFGCSRYF